MFTDTQIEALKVPLSSYHVKEREQGGRKFSYVEGWHAIAEANRIFGFDAWSRETLDLKCVSEREREIGQRKDKGWGVTYTARVRVSVKTINELLGMVEHVIREGSGSGHGIDRDLGAAHESALKEAETDAMKRALMTFGNPFGLALYDKEQRDVCDDKPSTQPLNAAKPASIAADINSRVEELTAWARKSYTAVLKMSGDDLKKFSDDNFQKIVELKGANEKAHAALVQAMQDRDLVTNPMGAG